MKAMLYLDQMAEPVAMLDEVKIVEFGSDNHPEGPSRPNLLQYQEPECHQDDGRASPRSQDDD